MDVFGVSIIAVLLSTVGFMLVGMVWYGPLFGKRWMAPGAYRLRARVRFLTGYVSGAIVLGIGVDEDQ